MNKEAMKMVKAKDLTYEYVRVLETDHGTVEEKVAALKNVNIEINKGDFVAFWLWEIYLCETYQRACAAHRRYPLGG